MEPPESFTACRFRLYPTRKQEKRMEATLETCRLLWNDALEQRNENWKNGKKRTTYGQQAAMLTEAVGGSPDLQAVYSQSRQECLGRLDVAFKRFFAHKSGHPRFKNQDECRSFTYPQASNGSVKVDIDRKRLHLSKIGDVKAVFHRKPPVEGMKTCTVKKDPDGKWHASLVYEEAVVPLQDVKIPDSWKSPIGIDLGLKSLITTSDGEKISPPKFYRKAEAKLVKLQRKLSRKQKGSKNRKKAKHLLAVQHSKVANQRLDFNQKLSTKLVKTHDLIGFEDLQIKNMVKNHCLAKSIHDAAWSQLVSLADYKAERGRRSKVIKVPAPYTTQRCFFCGALNKVPPDVREFMCVRCFRWLDRDVNSGRIVLCETIAQVGQDRSDETRALDESHPRLVPELKPAEAAKKQTTMSAKWPVMQELDAPIQALEAHGFSRGRMSPCYCKRERKP